MTKILNIRVGVFATLILSVLISCSQTLFTSNKDYQKFDLRIIDSKKDSVLFKPYSDSWRVLKRLDGSKNYEGTKYPRTVSPEGYDNYKSKFKNNTSNLWTILHPHIMNGSVTVYSGFNPKDPYMKDHGRLHYPITPKDSDEQSFFSDSIYKESLSNYLGQFGPRPDVPFSNMYGQDSVGTDGNKVYPPRGYYWYTDKDITRYYLREAVLLKKNGEVKKRIIESIAPVKDMSRRDKNPDYKELFWLDFDELKPILDTTYYLDHDGNVESYLDYFEKRKFKTDSLIEDGKSIQ